MNNVSVPEQIRRARLERDLTQQQLADAVGISRPIINKAETGEALSPNVALKLSEYLGLEYDLLLQWIYQHKQERYRARAERDIGRLPTPQARQNEPIPVGTVKGGDSHKEEASRSTQKDSAARATSASPMLNAEAERLLERLSMALHDANKRDIIVPVVNALIRSLERSEEP